MKILLTIAIVVALAPSAMAEVPSDSNVAPAPPRTGFEVALRTGFSQPLGNLGSGYDETMSDYPGQIPAILELGARVTPKVFVGAYFGAGLGLGNSPNISSTALHIGAEVQYHFVPEAGADPWVGYGLGYESLSENVFDERFTRYDGFEFAHLMGGANFRVSPSFGLGPFLDVSLGHYTSYHFRYPGEESYFPDQDRSISGMAVHSWITLGLRGTLMP
jgi:hypothetical protein